jgi:hypothetical protein
MAKTSEKVDPPFLSDVAAPRQRAGQHIQEGAVTPGYGADRETVLKLPAGLAQRSHAEYREGEDPRDMIRADLIGERVAIEFCREITAYVGERDRTSRWLLEDILASEDAPQSSRASLAA